MNIELILEKRFGLVIKKLKVIPNANKLSILFNAENTNFPILIPIGIVTPGALNFSQASIKLIAAMNPSHKNAVAILNL